MRLLITGADRPLGGLAAEHLSADHELRLCGAAPELHVDAHGYRRVDLRSPEEVEALVAGVEAVVHLAEFEPAPRTGPNAELETLEHASLGTYRLFTAAREAEVDRVVLASTLAFFEAYPATYRVDELWRPRPSTDVAQLAPFLAERVAQEFAREGGIRAVCLRFAPIGDDPEHDTAAADAMAAIDRALALAFTVPGCRWQVYHVASSPRFITRNARRGLGLPGKEGR